MRRRSEISQIISGAVGVIAINTVVWGIGFLLAINNYPNQFFILGVFLAGGIGIVQFIYVIPAIVWLRRQQQFTLMKGVIIGAVLTALGNGACYVIIAWPR